MKHGTRNCYTNHGCRCVECKEANTTYWKEWRNKVKSLPIFAFVSHGKYSTYLNYNCRCEPCKSAWSLHKQYQRIKKG